MSELKKGLFYQLTGNYWLLNSSLEIIMKTELAEKLANDYLIDVKKIIEISLGEGCALHSTKEECLDCPLENQVDPQGFPFVLLNKNQKKKEFWGRVDFQESEILLQISQREAPTELNDNNHQLFSYLTNIRESERKKIAQELHDGIAQNIYGLMLETRGLKWMSVDEQKEKFRELDRHFNETLIEVKNLARDLRPSALGELDLVLLLEQWIERTEQMTGYEIIFTVTGTEPQLSEKDCLAIYRVIQEATTNALKYSGTNELYLTFSFSKHEVSFSVEDFGTGFDVSAQRTGFGLLNMKERIFGIGGSIQIDSQPKIGTKISVSIPVEKGAPL